MIFLNFNNHKLAMSLVTLAIMSICIFMFSFFLGGGGEEGYNVGQN